MSSPKAPFLARLYISGWLYRFNELIGKLTAFCYRLLYPNLVIGARSRIWGRFRIMMFPGSNITIGDDFHMVSAPERSAITLFSRCQLTTYPGGRIRIGNRVGLNGTAVTSKKGIEIGDGTMIAPNVIIVDSDFHAQWPPDARFASSTEPLDREVSIGRNVWIGMNSIILKGVTIGDNTIIGAGSVVATSIPSNVLAAGNPARALRPLNVDQEPDGKRPVDAPTEEQGSRT